MGLGVLFALAAGLLWGLVFVGPLMLSDYPPLMLTLGRYLAFGLFALPLAVIDRQQLRQLTRADWWAATQLTIIGNFLYYLLLSSAIQRTGGALPTILIGTLPVVIAVTANLLNHERDGFFAWQKLLPALLLIAAGIVCVNHIEWQAIDHNSLGQTNGYWLGALLAVGAVACWTWYPLKNADWLRANSARQSRAWATAQGLVTLPLALIGSAIFWLMGDWLAPDIDLPWGPRPELYISLMIAIGLFASWLGTLCWNAASQRLPTALAGQLIVFETLAALSYTFLWRGQWPHALIFLGVALLIIGVFIGVRIKPRLTH